MASFEVMKVNRPYCFFLLAFPFPLLVPLFNFTLKLFGIRYVPPFFFYEPS